MCFVFILFLTEMYNCCTICTLNIIKEINMKQLKITPNQNICCLPVIDIEETFNENSKTNEGLDAKIDTINSSYQSQSEIEKSHDDYKLNVDNDINLSHFIPKAITCFCGNDQKTEAKNKIGVTFAQEAKCFQKTLHTPDTLFKKMDKDNQRKKIYVRNLDTYRRVPIVGTGISGSRYIYDNNSLLDYCMKWCKSVYFGRVVMRAIHNTGTLLLVFPGKALYFVQFLYGSSGMTEAQRKFQSDVFPTNVLEFHSFISFSNWMKKQLPLDA